MDTLLRGLLLSLANIALDWIIGLGDTDLALDWLRTRWDELGQYDTPTPPVS